MLMVVSLAACGAGGAPLVSPSLAPSMQPIASAGPTPNVLSVPSNPGASSVQFAGYSWSVRSDYGGPGPNQFSANNVWVDANGFLHLTIADVNGTWTTAEVVMNQSLGFGAYQFQVVGHPETMNNNVVLGLFTYPPASVGPDGTNEIDIEFATWGGAQTQHGNWTVWPAIAGPGQNTLAFDASANSGLSTHRFTWTSRSVTFQDMSGLTDGTNGMYASWTFAPPNYLQLVPQTPVPVHMNLWLFGGPPTDGKPVEIVISGFSFTPG